MAQDARGRGIPAALADLLERSPFGGRPVAVAAGFQTDADKLRTAFFEEDTDAVVAALTGQSVELAERWPGGSLYTATVGLTASASTGGSTDLDTLQRLHDWLDGALAADPALGGQAINAEPVTVDFVQRPGSDRVVIEAEVEVTYERGVG